MNYSYIDCPQCHVSMTPNDKLGLWECKNDNTVVEDRLPPPTLTDWEKYVAKTSTAVFEHVPQEVTLRCPAGCGMFISTDFPGCDKCGFKWGDEV